MISSNLTLIDLKAGRIFFLEIDQFSSPSNIAVFNTIFMDMYEKQQNILNVYGTKTVQSSTMTVEEPAFKFEL